MRNLIIGIIIGTVLGGGIAWAATYNIKLQTSNGVAVSASNPLPIQLN